MARKSSDPDSVPADGAAEGSADVTPAVGTGAAGTGAVGTRVPIAKTYKLYVGGAFPRSESGRTYQVRTSDGAFAANAAQGSRKDGRDAVVAARKAHGGWASATAYNRGQVIYRIAEMMEGRRDSFIELVRTGEGVSQAAAESAVDAAIDRVVHYAGWTDKIAAVFGGMNPVAGPYFCITSPEPTGVVAAVAPQDDSLLGLISVVLPIITSGNTVVVIASQQRPLPAIALAEVLATSDLPGGVINLLTGDAAEIMPHLAGHGDVNALDLTGCDEELGTSLAQAASSTVKRVHRPRAGLDFTTAPGTARLRAFLEQKTVWHPTGAVSLSGGSAY